MIYFVDAGNPDGIRLVEVPDVVRANDVIQFLRLVSSVKVLHFAPGDVAPETDRWTLWDICSPYAFLKPQSEGNLVEFLSYGMRRFGFREEAYKALSPELGDHLASMELAGARMGVWAYQIFANEWPRRRPVPRKRCDTLPYGLQFLGEGTTRGRLRGRSRSEVRGPRRLLDRMGDFVPN